MKLFKGDTEKNLQRDIDAARTSCTSLTSRLAAAEQTVTEKKAAARRAAMEGAEDNILDKAEAALRASQDRVSTLSAALVETKQRLAALEQELADAIDARTRAATAAEVTKLGEALSMASDNLVKAAGELAEIAGRIAVFSAYDGGSLQAYAKSLVTDVPPTIVMINESLRTYAAMVLNGSAAATLPQPAPPAPPLPQPAPVTTVFAVRHIAWRDATGAICTAGMTHDVALPPETAKRALKMGAVVETSNPVRRRTKDTVGIIRPSLEACTWLDEDPKPVSDSRPFSDLRVVEPTMKSPPVPVEPMFKEKIGQPRQVMVARSNPKGDES